MIKIALDAMGGDNAPEIIVQAACQAVKDLDNVEVYLYGQLDQVQPFIDQYGDHDRLYLVATSEEITMEDEPVKAIRRKKDASMVVAARTVKEGQADALISCGNTGALLAAGLLMIGRIKGVDRPGLMPIIPTINPDHPQFILMDSGANADCKPENLLQFAILANAYAKQIMNMAQPRVGLINNGTEASKGNALSKAAYELLENEKSIHFVGNVEAKSLMRGEVDIAVTDGFTGNAILKTLEGTAGALLSHMKHIMTHSGTLPKLGAGLLKNALKDGMAQMDPSNTGGAVLLGCKAPVIKAHGSADSVAVYNAIKQAANIVASGTIQQLTDFFESEQ